MLNGSSALSLHAQVREPPEASAKESTQHFKGQAAGVTGSGSDQDHIPLVKPGPENSGPCSHLLTGGNVVRKNFLDHTTMPLCGPEMEWNACRSPV